MRKLEAVGKKEEIASIDKWLARDCSDGGTNLVGESYIFVARSLRDQSRTRALKGPELVSEDRFKTGAIVSLSISIRIRQHTCIVWAKEKKSYGVSER